MRRRGLCGAAALLLLLWIPRASPAYSVLAHEALIDAVWSDQIAPILRQRFPGTPPQSIESARAYAYGGSLIQDLGYYPFGSRFFSNLVHYVRSGGFVESLIREARTVDEYAFALGALAHYTSDTVAHPAAVNRALPVIYPKLRVRHGDHVLYGESPARHVMVEFAFDVLQVARGEFTADAYQELIGFEVARAVLERAFRETYGLELSDLFGNIDLAIGTYRHAASRIVPDVTRAAWREKRDEILARTPDVTERDVVYTMTRQEYEARFGTAYRRPGWLARIVVAIFKVLPRFGPFRPLAFEPLTPEMERIFFESFAASRERYGELLCSLRNGRLALGDIDLDTGRNPARGVNRLADETYADLLSKTEGGSFVGPPALRRALERHYADGRQPTPASTR